MCVIGLACRMVTLSRTCRTFNSFRQDKPLKKQNSLQVAKTLTSASANPFFANTASSSFNPVLAIDVFLVQAATNTLLSHFTSLVICFLLLRAVDR